jgi:PAS domain S-box-containing protein
MQWRFESLSEDAMVVVDEVGTIVFVNEQASRMFGYAMGELNGLSVEVLLPKRFRLAHIGRRLRFTDVRGARPMGAVPPVFALCKDGTERPVVIGLDTIQRDQRSFVVATIRE